MATQKILSLASAWVPPVVWAGIIFLLSSYSTLPGLEIIWWDFILKKSAHIFMYAGLFFWLQRAINYQRKSPRYLLAFILTILYAFSDEYHQSFVPGRTALLSDIGFDTIGAALVLLRLKQII